MKRKGYSNENSSATVTPSRGSPIFFIEIYRIAYTVLSFFINISCRGMPGYAYLFNSLTKGPVIRYRIQ